MALLYFFIHIIKLPLFFTFFYLLEKEAAPNTVTCRKKQKGKVERCKKKTKNEQAYGEKITDKKIHLEVLRQGGEPKL